MCFGVEKLLSRSSASLMSRRSPISRYGSVGIPPSCHFYSRSTLGHGMPPHITPGHGTPPHITPDRRRPARSTPSCTKSAHSPPGLCAPTRTPPRHRSIIVLLRGARHTLISSSTYLPKCSLPRGTCSGSTCRVVLQDSRSLEEALDLQYRRFPI